MGNTISPNRLSSKKEAIGTQGRGHTMRGKKKGLMTENQACAERFREMKTGKEVGTEPHSQWGSRRGGEKKGFRS